MDIHQQVLAAFQVEHKEHVACLRSILAALRDEHGGVRAGEPRGRWDEAFRMAHTLKGGARVCDLRDVEALGHRLESLFAKIREGTLTFDDHVAKTVSRVLDEIEDGMAALAGGAAARSIAQTLDELEHILAGSTAAPAAFPLPPSGPAAVIAARPFSEPRTPATPPGEPVTAEPSSAPAPADAGAANEGETPLPAPPPEIETVRVQTVHLDALARSVDAFVEVNTEHDRLTGEFTRLADQLRELQRQCDAASAKVAPLLRRQSDAPELGGVERHIDAITQGVRRLGRQLRAARASQKRLAWTVRASGEDARVCTQRLRMISAENVLQGLAPMVRSLAREMEKEVEFTTIGLHVHADRSVLHAVREAVLHALRNAVVHGIEPPAERVARGKPREGRITLTLQNGGDHLRVLVEDDGRGIDPQRVRQAAQRHGVQTPDEPAGGGGGGDESLMRLLFRPGFTTSETVTELAGRGMGLSIVHEHIARLHGSTRLGPRPGGGATLEIRVPLVISSERLLLVSCAEQTFAVPTRAVDGLVRVPTTQVQRVGERRVVMVDETPLSLLPFLRPVGERSPRNADGKLLVVALRGERGQGETRAGIVVDRFLAEREAMVRPITGAAAGAPCFCGAIVLEENEVALVIDPSAITGLAAAGVGASVRRGGAASARGPSTRPPKVLVVDDSFTTRTLEKSILETNGYEVRIAVDGVEALRSLRHDPVDVVVADVQMPRMDGLSLLREIRGDEKTAGLPVILVTSLDKPEDHQRSVELGASAYIVKRRFDHQDLLNTIRQFAEVPAQ